MANKIYSATETAISFQPSGGTVVFTPTSLADAAGRVSAVHDLGAGSHAGTYYWQARTRAATSPTVGRTVRIYVLTGMDGTYEDSDLTAGDGAVSSEDLLRNATGIGAMVASEASTTRDFVRSGGIYVTSRYIRVAWWNDLGVALSATAADHAITLWPTPEEIQ